MKSYSASDKPSFSSSISIVEPTDPAHADNINAAPKQLLENTAANRNEITELKKESLPKTGDSSENIVTFESADSKNVTSWTDVPVMESKEKHKSLFKKVSTMIKNVRFLYEMLNGKVNITSLLETIEQVDANTSAENIANALVIKALKAELMNSINQINSNLTKCIQYTGFQITNVNISYNNEINAICLNVLWLDSAGEKRESIFKSI